MDFSAVSGIFDKILKYLPTSPFITFINKMQDLPYLGYLNYFLPISQIIAIGEAWLVADSMIHSVISTIWN